MKYKQLCATPFFTAALALLTCGYPSHYTTEGEAIPPHAGIEILLSDEKIFETGTLQARCLLLHADGTRSVPADDDILWSPVNPMIIEVDSSGLVTGLSAGETELRAEALGFTGARRIIVEHPPDFSRVMISEVFFDPVSPEDQEFIEIYNGHDEEKDISGFMLVDGTTSSKAFIFPENTRIGPGKRLVAARNIEGFLRDFKFVPDLGPFGYSLNNSGETAFLCLPDGTVTDAVYIKGGSSQFPSTETWGSSKLPSAPEGKTVARKSDLDTDTWEDWEESVPTPGW